MATIDVTPIHNELLKVNARYRNAVETALIMRDEELPETVNSAINGELSQSGKTFELYTTELLYSAYINPSDSALMEGITGEEDDWSYSVISDKGVNIVGNRMSLNFNWTDIKYCIVSGEDFTTLELHNDMLVHLGGTNVARVIPEILTSYNRNYPETFKVLQEIIIED